MHRRLPTQKVATVPSHINVHNPNRRLTPQGNTGFHLLRSKAIVIDALKLGLDQAQNNPTRDDQTNL